MSDSILIASQVFPQILWGVEAGTSLGLSGFPPSRGNANTQVERETLPQRIIRRVMQEDTHAVF